MLGNTSQNPQPTEAGAPQSLGARSLSADPSFPRDRSSVLRERTLGTHWHLLLFSLRFVRVPGRAGSRPYTVPCFNWLTFIYLPHTLAAEIDYALRRPCDAFHVSKSSSGLCISLKIFFLRFHRGSVPAVG